VAVVALWFPGRIGRDVADFHNFRNPSTGESGMKIQEIRKIAKYWGIDTKVGRSKQELIRDIQVREGNEPCFQTRQECENDCLWKEDCLKKPKK
jgi:hypothetical protein